MAHYIDKSAVVAEIEKIIADETESIKSFEHGKNVSEVQRSNARISVLEYMRSFLDTLEVKEVDLEKEIDNFYGMYRKDGKTFLLEDNEECVDWKVDCNPEFEKSFAKHFFELGLKAQKGEEV